MTLADSPALSLLLRSPKENPVFAKEVVSNSLLSTNLTASQFALVQQWEENRPTRPALALLIMDFGGGQTFPAGKV